jgi:hypothetical protein
MLADMQVCSARKTLYKCSKIPGVFLISVSETVAFSVTVPP